MARYLLSESRFSHAREGVPGTEQELGWVPDLYDERQQCPTGVSDAEQWIREREDQSCCGMCINTIVMMAVLIFCKNIIGALGFSYVWKYVHDLKKARSWS